MNYQSQYANEFTLSQNTQSNGKAVAGLVIGIISMITWLLPIIGLVTAIIGLVLSNRAMYGMTQLGMARAGKVLSSIALVLAIFNMVAGIMLAMH